MNGRTLRSVTQIEIEYTENTHARALVVIAEIRERWPHSELDFRLNRFITIVPVNNFRVRINHETVHHEELLMDQVPVEEIVENVRKALSLPRRD